MNTPRFLVFLGYQGDIKFIHVIIQKRLKKLNLLEYIKQFKIPHTYSIEIV